jgi:hypothetical protein
MSTARSHAKRRAAGRAGSPTPARAERTARPARSAWSARAARTGAAAPPPNQAQGGTRARTARRLGRLTLAAAVAAVAVMAAGPVAFDRTRSFLDYGAGVLSLVSLTAAVLWGLLATDRNLLRPRHRIVAQGVHRAGAVAGLGFLALHVWVKIAERHTTPTAAAVPIADHGKPFLVGLGTLAAYLFLAVAATGALRSVFLTPRRARLWRILHGAAYLAWPAGLVHGLTAGRPAASWVVAMYAAAGAGIAVVLALRLRTRLTATPPAAAPGAPVPPTAATTARPVAPPPPRPRIPGPQRPSQHPAGLLEAGGHVMPPPPYRTGPERRHADQRPLTDPLAAPHFAETAAPRPPETAAWPPAAPPHGAPPHRSRIPGGAT